MTKILLFAAQASHQLVPPEVSTPPVLGDVKNGQQTRMELSAFMGRGKRESGQTLGL